MNRKHCFAINRDTKIAYDLLTDLTNAHRKLHNNRSSRFGLTREFIY